MSNFVSYHVWNSGVKFSNKSTFYRKITYCVTEVSKILSGFDYLLWIRKIKGGKWERKGEWRGERRMERGKGKRCGKGRGKGNGEGKGEGNNIKKHFQNTTTHMFQY